MFFSLVVGNKFPKSSILMTIDGFYFSLVLLCSSLVIFLNNIDNSIVLMQLIFYGGQTHWCSQLTPGSALVGHTYGALGIISGARNLNRVWLYARQMSYLLFCCSIPAIPLYYSILLVNLFVYFLFNLCFSPT